MAMSASDTKLVTFYYSFINEKLAITEAAQLIMEVRLLNGQEPSQPNPARLGSVPLSPSLC